MEWILITMLSGLAVNLITRLSWKLNLSKTYVSVGMSILLWVILYVGQLLVNRYPLERQQILEFVSWCYAMSQVVYNLYNKIKE